MPTRCPATDTLDVGGAPLTLQCVHWSHDPDGRHPEDVHLIHTPPMPFGDDHTWPNTNPLPVEEPPADA